jgi:uncharacterized membrane protein YjfL (UPF0719 family)
MEIFAGIKIAGVIATLFYSLLGLILLVSSYIIVDRLTHFSLHEEVAEKQNIAVAIVIGALLIALSVIIAAVISS